MAISDSEAQNADGFTDTGHIYSIFQINVEPSSHIPTVNDEVLR
jgi:hypothetical protein